LAARRQIKNTHINAIALERGGFNNLGPADYGRAGQRIREQYGYLSRFASQIADGTQKLDGTLDYRLRLYAQAGRETFYRSQLAHITPGGPTHLRSKRNVRDSCKDCIELDGRVYAIGDPSFRVPGQRQCLSNCRCTIEYLSLSDGAYQVLEEA
jgi:hypothetical protein